MLTKQLKDKWVKALRSGKYERGEGQLCRYNEADRKYEYCCLGVLAHVQGVDDEFMCNGVGLLEKSFCNDVGIEQVIPIGIQNKLAAFNDGKYDEKKGKYDYKSFKWIAAYIERYL